MRARWSGRWACGTRLRLSWDVLRCTFATAIIRPLSNRIVVRRADSETVTPGGLIIPDNAKEKPLEGTVVSVGAGKRLADGSLVALDVKEGDRILFLKYAGTEVKIDGTDLIVIGEDDVLGVLG